LRLSEPALLLPGDHFIVRKFSPVVTIGGGVVLDAAPLTHRMKAEDRLSFLRSVESASQEQVLLVRVRRRGKFGLSLGTASSETGWTRERSQALLSALAQAKQIVRAADFFISAEAFQTAARELLLAVASFHDANPLVAGIGKEELRERIDLAPEVFATTLDDLVTTGKLEVSADQVRAAGRGVVMKDEEAESKKIIETAFASAGLKVPALKDVLAGLKVDHARAQKIVTLLLRDKTLVKISEDLVFHHDTLLDLRQRMAAEKARSPRMDVARFKDLTGVTRKYAIPLLEYLDREHVTRRVGDERIIL
jgi:selenocysteine-specific elongation factor